MNLHDSDILLALAERQFASQRTLSEESGHSLGVVNKSLRSLTEEGYIDSDYRLTEKGRKAVDENAPKRAVILAAGFGMRMIPINLTTPKALLEVNGERLINRQIAQLHEAGITDITVVVGFMKDSFEYLIDRYGVRLVYNPDYAVKNNISSLALVLGKLDNAYIVPCDIWCDSNPFRKREMYSWYMVSDLIDDESTVRVNRKGELVKSSGSGNTMIGIAYLLKNDADEVRNVIEKMASDSAYNESFWEEALYQKDRMFVSARVVRSSDVVEINTYEQLRELDSDSNHLHSDAISAIAHALEVKPSDITDIKVLKKGMTNRSFLFSAKGRKYIMRIPGEGTDQLINRFEEAAVFKAISGLGLCDDPVYINPQNGYKITAYLEGVRVCDCENEDDLKKCMTKLRAFHEMRLTVPHTFDIFGQIDFYESLWNGADSIYMDYKATKENVLSLRSFIDDCEKDWCLTHIDAVPDNFLFYMKDGKEELQLTDWEYSGMQDPLVDIAMFSIYSLYEKEQIDKLITIYFGGECLPREKARIYCYVASCGLLWSNWCEYKRQLGVEFGEYSLRQYRYAKDFFRFAREEIARLCRD